MTTDTATSEQADPARPSGESSAVRRVGLAYRSTEVIKPAVHLGRLSSIEILLVAAGIGLLVASFISVRAGPLLPVPPVVNAAALRLGAVAALAGGLLPLLIWSIRVPTSHPANVHLLSAVRRHPATDRQVWLVGFEEQLKRVLSYGPIEDASFEPIVIRDRSPSPGTTICVLGIAPGLALALTQLLLIRSGLLGIQHYALMATAYALILVLLISTPALSPRYIRITPGLFETIRLSYLPWRKPRVVRCSLRAERIEIDLRQNTIWSMDASGERTTIALTNLRMRDRLAYHALLAAVSTATVPDLPEDALVG